MPQVIHDFRITVDALNPTGPYSGGLRVQTSEEVEALSCVCGLPLWPHTPDDPRLVLELDENDPRLTKLYATIWNRYGIKPSPSFVVPVADRHLFFGVKRKLTWSRKEIDACELLWLRSTQLIAKHASRTQEQLEHEDYVAELDSRQRSAVQFGSLMPFTALAVAEPLHSELLGAGLVGLNLPEVRFVPENRKAIKLLWALKSTVTLPRALNLLQGENGNAVEPNTEWWCWWDDGGRDPVVLRYPRAVVAGLKSFDIAMTLERVGQTEQGAYRQCIVTQRFREVMTKLKVKGVDYAPVVLA